MLRNISWKALPISNAAYFAAGVVIMLALVLATQCVLYFRDPAASVHATIKLVAASPITALLFIPCASLVAGYVGGRIAKRQYILNGALGTAVAALWSLHELVFDSSQASSNGSAWLETTTNALTTFAGPFLGAYGGHLAGLRQLRLDAMTIEERQPRGFRFYVVVVARWVAAFAAAAILYFGILAIGMKTIGFFRWLPVMATMAAITGGTFVFPSQHRNAGSLLLIALVIIAPLAVLLSHVSAGNASYGHSLMVIYNALGAMLTYQSMGSFPGVQRQSTQWWWLSYYSGLSKGQRSARRYLLFVGFAIGLLLYFLILALANWRGVDSHLAVVAIVVTLPVGFLAARPLCGWLWPDMLQQADHDARLGLARVGPAFD